LTNGQRTLFHYCDAQLAQEIANRWNGDGRFYPVPMRPAWGQVTGMLLTTIDLVASASRQQWVQQLFRPRGGVWQAHGAFRLVCDRSNLVNPAPDVWILEAMPYSTIRLGPIVTDYAIRTTAWNPWQPI